MNHFLARRVLGDPTRVPISDHDYNAIAGAKSSLLHALYVEDKFDIVLQNYAELEIALLSRAMDHVLYQTIDWSSSIAALHVIGRRLINLLTTCRLYLDQTGHDLREMLGDESPAHELVKNAKREEYDAHLGFRVLEALRNHVQHRGFPIHRVTLDGQVLGIGAETSCRTIAIPEVDVDELGRDGKFKGNVLCEMQSLGRYVDLRPFVRVYVASIGRIHEVVRSAIDARFLVCTSILQNAVEEFVRSGGSDTIGLAAVEEDDNGVETRHVEIFSDLMERRDALIRKNRNISHFAHHFVSNGSRGRQSP